MAEGFKGRTEPARSLGAERQVRTWRGCLHPPSRAVSAFPVPVGTWPTQGVKLSCVGMATSKQRLSMRDPGAHSPSKRPGVPSSGTLPGQVRWDKEETPGSWAAGQSRESKLGERSRSSPPPGCKQGTFGDGKDQLRPRIKLSFLVCACRLTPACRMLAV